MIKTCGLSVWLLAAIPALAAPPPMPSIPSPSAAQMQQSMPADLFNTTPNAIQAWLLPVSQNIALVEAQALVQQLQGQNYNAFYVEDGDKASVFIGPEASVARLQEISELLKKQALPVADPILYQPLNLKEVSTS